MEPNFEELDFSQAQELVKGRQRFQRRPKRAADLLGKLMARKGYAQTESVNELEATWQSLVGAKWQSKTKTSLVRGGVLEVLVTSSAVNHQLEFQKKKLLKQLQTRLPQNNFKDIRFKVGNLS